MSSSVPYVEMDEEDQQQQQQQQQQSSLSINTNALRTNG